MISLGHLSRREAVRYMGVKGKPDSTVEALLDRIEPLVLENIKPAYVFRQAAVSSVENGIKLDCMDAVLTGKDIVRHLRGCDQAVLFAATLSAGADKLIRQLAVSDMAGSLAADSLCSAAVEQLCDLAEEEIFSRIKTAFRTWRYSPGYGDLPLTLQDDFLTALNAQRRIGLTVNESCLLIPSKSVTAIIGLSEKPVNSGAAGCLNCNMRQSCAFNTPGRYCGNSKKHGQYDDK